MSENGHRGRTPLCLCPCPPFVSTSKSVAGSLTMWFPGARTPRPVLPRILRAASCERGHCPLSPKGPWSHSWATLEWGEPCRPHLPPIPLVGVSHTHVYCSRSIPFSGRWVWPVLVCTGRNLPHLLASSELPGAGPHHTHGWCHLTSARSKRLAGPQWGAREAERDLFTSPQSQAPARHPPQGKAVAVTARAQGRRLGLGRGGAGWCLARCP